MFIADTHSDTLFSMGVRHQTDGLMITPEKLRQGGVTMQTFALWTGRDGDRGDYNGIVASELSQVPVMEAAGMKQVFSPDEAKEGESCFLLSMEGGEPLCGGLDSVRAWYGKGVRMVALTWNNPNAIGFPAKGGSRSGLTAYGLKCVRELQKFGMAVDTSHLNEAGFFDIFAKTDKPPIASHSCCRALCGHERNLTDEQLRLLIREGGYVGVNFYPAFLSDDGRADIARVAEHIDHICQLGGSGIVGFGSDFDGIESTPAGLEDASKIPVLLQALRDRGFDEASVAGVAGENLRAYFRRIV